MTINRPTVEEVQAAALEIGIHFDAAEAAVYHELMQGQLDAYDLVDSLKPEMPETIYPRSAGEKPEPKDNPYNAWAVKSTIKGSGKGKLVNKTVAIKDNVSVAGVQCRMARQY